MAQGYAIEVVGVLDGTVNPASKSDARVTGGRKRGHRFTLDLALATVAKVNGDTNVLARIPRGQVVTGITFNSTVTLGATTVAIGNATTANKYKNAAVFTTPDTPTGYMNAAAQDDTPLTDYEDVILTFGAANAPGAGVIVGEVHTLGR